MIIMAKEQTVLFHSTIFGPIHSRRLGVSLGINLSPNDGKVCSFDCIYCEAGYNAQGCGTTGLPIRERVKEDLRRKLSAMKSNGDPLDVITFSGNGEPTLNPDFRGLSTMSLHCAMSIIRRQKCRCSPIPPEFSLRRWLRL